MIKISIDRAKLKQRLKSLILPFVISSVGLTIGVMLGFEIYSFKTKQIKIEASVALLQEIVAYSHDKLNKKNNLILTRVEEQELVCAANGLEMKALVEELIKREGALR